MMLKLQVMMKTSWGSQSGWGGEEMGCCAGETWGHRVPPA